MSYQTAYLKAHYPSEFFAATLNAEMGSNDAGRFEKIATLWAEARRRGIRVLPPDANRSHARFRPIDGVIPYALGAIKGVGTEASKRIAEAREKGGTFMGIGDLARRVNLADLKRQGVENLARSGAFDSIEPNRKRLHCPRKIWCVTRNPFTMPRQQAWLPCSTKKNSKCASPFLQTWKTLTWLPALKRSAMRPDS